MGRWAHRSAASEVQSFAEWLKAYPAREKLVIAGRGVRARVARTRVRGPRAGLAAEYIRRHGFRTTKQGDDAEVPREF